MKWREHEINKLREHFPSTPNQYIAKNILTKRSDSAIQKKAERVGLEKNDDFMIRWKIQNNNPPNYNKYEESFLVGLVCGDGSFSKTDNGDSYKFILKIEMNKDGNVEMIKRIQEYLSVGKFNTYKRGDSDKEVIQYTISSIPIHIAVTIPIFERNKFYADYKKEQYELWKQDLFEYAQNRFELDEALFPKYD